MSCLPTGDVRLSGAGRMRGSACAVDANGTAFRGLVTAGRCDRATRTVVGTERSISEIATLG